MSIKKNIDSASKIQEASYAFKQFAMLMALIAREWKNQSIKIKVK